MRQLARREAEPPSLFESFVRRLRELTLGESASGDLRETIEDLIDEAQESGPALGKEERVLVHNALEFGELRVDDIMVPRADVRGIDAGAGIHEIVGALQAAGHSRLVVYRGGLDDVVGVVHIKDLLPFWGDGTSFALDQVVRPVLVVPPSMRAMDLLLEMRVKRNHAAMVVDEFGGIDGLVTVGDLLEQLVGDLQDEHDLSTPPQIAANADGTWDADGRVDLEEVEQALGRQPPGRGGARRGRHAGRADLRPRRSRAGARRRRPASERLRVRGAGCRPAAHQAGAHPPTRPGARPRPRRRARELSSLTAPARSAGAGMRAGRLSARPLTASLLAGLAAGLAVPPLWFLPGLLGFAVLAHLLAPGRGRLGAFAAGTLFGFGYFAVGLYWVAIAFFVDAERFGLLAVPAVALLCLGLGMTVGVGALVVAGLRLRSVPARALALAVVWSAAELVRNHLLQFPWNPIAVAWTVSDPTLQAIAWLGCTGLGLVTVAVAASARPTLARGAAAPAPAAPPPHHRPGSAASTGPACRPAAGEPAPGPGRRAAEPEVGPAAGPRLVRAPS